MTHIREHLIAIPFEGTDVIEVMPQQNQLATAIAAVHRTGRHTNVASKFWNRVETLSQCIMHDDIPPIDDGHARGRARVAFRPCLTAPMCWCSEEKQDT